MSRPETAERLAGLEAARGYAALSIILLHTIWIGGVMPPPPLDFMRWWFGFGVPLFFTVSAFTLGYGYWGRLGSPAEASAFFIRRFFRIAPLYYAMLAYQLLWLRFQHGMVPPMADVAASASFTFGLVPRLADGIVPASWSIGVEMLFYLLFPLTPLFCRTPLRTAAVAAISLLVATMATADLQPLAPMAALRDHGFLKNAPYFCAGMLACHGYRWIERQVAAQRHRLLGGVLLLSVPVTLAGLLKIAYAVPGTGEAVWWNAAWGLPFGLLCVGLALCPVGLLVNRATVYLGRISFSMYLCHPAIVNALTTYGAYQALLKALPIGTAASFLPGALGTIGLVIALASVTYRLIERPGMAWGRRLADRQRRRSARADVQPTLAPV